MLAKCSTKLAAVSLPDVMSYYAAVAATVDRPYSDSVVATI